MYKQKHRTAGAVGRRVIYAPPRKPTQSVCLSNGRFINFAVLTGKRAFTIIFSKRSFTYGEA